MTVLPDLTPWRPRLSRQRWYWLLRGALCITVSGGGALFSAWMALDVLTRLEPDHQAEAAALTTQVAEIRQEVSQLQARLDAHRAIEANHDTTQQQAKAFLGPMQAALDAIPPGLGVIGIERDLEMVRWRVQFAHVTALTAFERALHAKGLMSAAKEVSRQDALMTLTLEWFDD